MLLDYRGLVRCVCAELKPRHPPSARRAGLAVATVGAARCDERRTAEVLSHLTAAAMVGVFRDSREDAGKRVRGLDLTLRLLQRAIDLYMQQRRLGRVCGGGKRWGG